MRAWSFLWALVLACAPHEWVAAESAPAGPLVFAVHPYLAPDEINRRYAPLADLISRSLRRSVTLRTGSSYTEHINAVGHDQLDIAMLGPASYVRVLERYGSKPLLARFEIGGQEHLSGVIIVARDGPLRSLADLRGRRFAFGDPESTSSYYVPAWLLLKSGLPITALGGHGFLGSNSNVALAVLAGDYDGGAVRREVYDQYASRGLRVLAELPATPDPVFVTRANLPPADVERLRALLLGLHETPEGARVLSALHPNLTRLAPASESDYAALREMMLAVAAVE